MIGQRQQRMMLAGQSVELTIRKLTEFLQAVGLAMWMRMLMGMGMLMRMLMRMRMVMGMRVGMPRRRLLLQLLDLQPAMPLGLLVAITAVNPTGAQQGAGTQETLGHQAITGPSTLAKVYGRSLVQERNTATIWRRWRGIRSGRGGRTLRETQPEGQGTWHMNARVVASV